MSKTKFLLLVIIVSGLAGLSHYVNRNWFSEQPIHISHRVSPWAAKSPQSRRVVPPGPGSLVVFNFDPFCRFTSLRVFIAAEIETNEYARPVWDLTTSLNSIPVGSFTYGARIRGMKPAVNGATADPLQPGVVYRLVVEIANKQLRHDFSTSPRQ